LVGGGRVLQLLEIDLQEEFAFFCYFVWVCLEENVYLPQQLLTFLVLDCAESVVVEGDVAIDPLGVRYVEEMRDEGLNPGFYGHPRAGTRQMLCLPPAEFRRYLPF
jgi:hypothetical protein